MVSKVVMAAIGLLVAVVLFGAAMTSFTAQSTTGWGTTLTSIWALLPLLGILGIALTVFAFAKGRMGG